MYDPTISGEEAKDEAKKKMDMDEVKKMAEKMGGKAYEKDDPNLHSALNPSPREANFGPAPE